MYTHYDVTFSKGTSRHDESRLVKSNVPAERLAATITRIQSQGHSIYSVEAAR